MRRAFIAMTLLAAAGCGGGHTARQAPPTNALVIPRPANSPTGRPRPAPPGTVCGHVTTLTQATARVIVVRGRTTCAEALQVFRKYFDPETPAEGAAGLVVIGQWTCGTRGTVTSCTVRATTIQARA